MAVTLKHQDFSVTLHVSSHRCKTFLSPETGHIIPLELTSRELEPCQEQIESGVRKCGGKQTQQGEEYLFLFTFLSQLETKTSKVAR